jgi:site-specific recombinase XerD
MPLVAVNDLGPLPRDLCSAALGWSPECIEAFQEFVLARLANANTRVAYARACAGFIQWSAAQSLALGSVRPVHLAAYVRKLELRLAPSSVVVHLTAIRRMFAWFVERQLLPLNPASSTRSARSKVHTGATPALTADEVSALYAEFTSNHPRDARDRALISLMLYCFLRISAVLALRAEDVDLQSVPGAVRVREKGDQLRSIPLHPQARADLADYLALVPIKGRQALFVALKHGGTVPAAAPLRREQAYMLVRRRLASAGIDRIAGCHAFRATGITRFLSQGGRIETAAHLAGHVSLRTTQLYDRRQHDAAATELALLSF